MHHIQGEARNQFQLVCLEQIVAPDSFVRAIDVFVDAIDLEKSRFYSFNYITPWKSGAIALLICDSASFCCRNSPNKTLFAGLFNEQTGTESGLNKNDFL